MILIPILDIALLLLNVFLAISNRGTIWGWLATAFVIWQSAVLVKFVRSNP